MKNRKALAFFLLGSAAVLLAAALLLFWLHRHPLAASLAGTVLLAAGALALLLRRLPPLLRPLRTAERQLTALLRKSHRASLLYCDTPEEDAVPSLSLPVSVELREGLTAFYLSLPAGNSDLPGLLALPAGTELTLVFLTGPAQVLSFTGSASPLPPGGSPYRLLFRAQTLRLPRRPRPIPVQARQT